MSFTARWTSEADAQYRAIRDDAARALHTRKQTGKSKASKQEGLFKQVNKCIENLISNPRHRSLSTHEYDSIPHPWDNKKKVFEAYAQNNTPSAYRVFWCYGPGKNELTIVAIIPHP